MNLTLFSVVCVSAVVLAALAALVYVLFNQKPEKVTATDTPAAKSFNPKKWIVPIMIALVVAFWSIWGALFFIVIAWLLRMSPNPDASFTVGNNEKKTARRVYTFLFLSPIIAVPIFIGRLFSLSDSSPSINQSVLAALIPLIVYSPILLGLTSTSAFVYRHTQQGLLFVALRAGMASLVVMNIENHLDYAISLFFFGNGALWLFGSIAGWSQTSNGKCWFMDRKGETIILQGSASLADPVQAQEQLGRSRQQLNGNQKLLALNNALGAFRQGDQKSRQEAVKILDILGEVENF